MSYAALELVEPPSPRDVTHGAPSSPVKGGGKGSEGLVLGSDYRGITLGC
jgi:hypothetical protein